MTKLEQSIALTHWHFGTDEARETDYGLWWAWKSKDGTFIPVLILDIDDLNVIQTIETHLETHHPSLCLVYVSALYQVISGNGVVGDFRFVHSTASQRREALLRTIGKWKD
jgi:hypothetical protein